MDTSRKFAPEAVAGLRRLLGGLPLSIRSVVLRFNWQRSGCISCRRSDHSIYDCPYVAHERTEDIARDAFQRWCGLVGEELLLFASTSSASIYITASEERVKLRARPPFHFRRADNATGNRPQHQVGNSSAHNSEPKQVPQPVDRNYLQGIAPMAAKQSAANVRQRNAPKPSAPQLLQREGTANGKPNAPKPSAGQSLQRAVDGKPSTPKPSANPPLQRQDVPILPLPTLLPISKGLLPTPPKTSKLNQPKPVLFIGSKPAKSTAALAAGSSSSSAASPPMAASVVDVATKTPVNCKDAVLEADWRVSAEDDWDVNRVAMDSHGRTAGDLAMAQAKLCGCRRGRPSSPNGSPNPAKFICISDEQPEDGEQQFTGSQPSQDLADLSSQPSSRKIDYETWDLKRYQHAITVDARRRFWTFASEVRKRKLTAELLQLSPSSNTQKQAQTMGWLRKDGEQNA